MWKRTKSKVKFKLVVWILYKKAITWFLIWQLRLKGWIMYISKKNVHWYLPNVHYRWRAGNFYLCSALMPTEQWGSIAWHTYCDTGHLFIMVISEDPWHSHLLPSVWRWSCHYLSLWLRSVAAGIRTPKLPLAGRTLEPTAPQPQRKSLNLLQ